MTGSTLRSRSGEAAMISSTVGDLLQEYDHDYWRSCLDDDELPEELWSELADLGFTGITVPQEYGGQGMGMTEQAALVETVTRHGVMVPYLVVSAAMAPIPMANYGSEQLKERFLPDLASGDVRFCFAITEPDAGTNSFKIQTHAERDGDEYIINGQKIYISGADRADFIQLVTRTTPYEVAKREDPRYGGTLLVVPTDAAGLEMNELDTAINESTGQYSLFFDDVRVPVENRVGEVDKGFFHMFDALNPERILLSAGALGLGQFVHGRAVDYANQREVFGAPIGSHQGVQHPLAKTKVDLELGGMAVDQAASLFDAGAENAGPFANMANYAATEAADEAMDVAIQTHGGNGFSRDYDIVVFRNMIRLFRIAPINNEMVLNTVAERILGLPRSY